MLASLRSTSIAAGASSVLLLAMTSCFSQFQGDRFQHATQPYAVFYPTEGSADAPFGPVWKLANVTPRGNAKQGPAYSLVRAYDADDDGDIDWREKAPRYDLLFRHEQRDAAMWVRSVPLPLADQNKELATLADRYLQAVADHRRVDAPFGVEREPPVKGQRHFHPVFGFTQEQVVVVNATPHVARTLNSYGCTIAGRPAHRIDITVTPAVPVDDPTKLRAQHGTVVLVQLQAGSSEGHYRRQVEDMPSVLLVGLSTADPDSEDMQADFSRLLGTLAFGDAAGAAAKSSAQHSCDRPPSGGQQGGAVPAMPALLPFGDASERPSASPAEPLSKSEPDALLAACPAAVHLDTQAAGTCTEIGCTNGFSLSVYPRAAWRQGQYRFLITRDGESTTCTGSLPLNPCGQPNMQCDRPGISIGESGCGLPPSQQAFGDIHFDSYPQQVQIEAYRDGQLLTKRTFMPAYRAEQPNGPGCAPICCGAAADFAVPNGGDVPPQAGP